jgi:hypothetical protein
MQVKQQQQGSRTSSCLLVYAMQHRTLQSFMGSLFKHIIATLEKHYDHHKQFVTILQGNDQQINPSACLQLQWSRAHSAPNTVLSLSTVASKWHVGGVLQQLSWGSWQPLAFYSKKLSGVGSCYSTFDRELLAAFSAIFHNGAASTY